MIINTKKQFIYEIFRKTNETFICCQINFRNKKNNKNFININSYYFKHLLDHFSINSEINLNINLLGDLYIDEHHIIEDLGITLGRCVKYFIPLKFKNYINRYGFYYIPLDESLSRVVTDFSGRSYLSYNIYYNNFYIKNFNVNLIYDFFLSFSNNSFITIYIDNIIGYNTHHIFETVFKAFGKSLKESLILNNNINSTKKLLF
ncbi:imidazoleglycerol-phosphate dehydratase [Candidatus Nasuia deltocephalinicola]|uniref:imidazoleglycerol-phosphate dehydratase n=1 Tax=Candidatus Nasuia deltocephalincola TaxID=1160784 RepID=UPI00216B36A1|nr:imidazoleglycerol-phosphate dehydratase [Candidatus Nasuia deltocephalinicola]